jgi:hypothetical protein
MLFPLFATGIVDTSGKFATGVVDTIPAVHLHLRISLRIEEKIRNGSNVIFGGLGEVDS